ncbi:YlbF family regulator [Brevibacillus choshinensis]|uniref:YlbF family regulator n=1 Tax=Brevibacillus choshinensis TaxID=54911 RepID=UPI002E1E9906|nr:YlbF family regulator [Brevibacillus choshinensis]
MGSVVGITAYLQAKNELSPHLTKVVQMTKNAAKEMLQLDEATQNMIKEMQKIKRAAEQGEQGFKREMDKMRREVQELKRQLGVLGSTRAKPKVDIDDQASREIAAIRQEVKALDGTKAKVQIEAAGAGGSFMAGGVVGGIAAYGGGGYIDQLSNETQANARRSLIGDTPDELLRFQREAQDLTLINPNVDRTHIKDLMTQATRFDQQNGVDITKQALQLNAIRPDMGGVEEYQKTMFAMHQSWKDITDVGRFGDTLAEIANTTTDIRGEALDSIVEYSTQVTKFLDTPEKLAALMKEMNGLWSIDKGFDPLKEATIKLDNQGDLNNVLKTAYEAQGMDSEQASKKAEQETKVISTAIHSDNEADNQFAIAALLQNFGSIKDDKVRQNLLNELGGGPGEDIAKAFAPLLKAAGRIGMADSSEFNYNGRLDQSYKTYQENDPLRGFTEAKTMFSNELVSLGLVLAQDFAPTIKWAAEGLKSFKGFLDSLPKEAAVATFIGVVGGTSLALWGLVAAAKSAAKALVSLPADLIRKKLGGEIPDIDFPGGPDKKGKGRKGGKRQWWNPLSWGGGKEEPPKKSWLTSKEAADMAFGKGTSKDVPAKTGWLDKAKSLGGLLPQGDKVFPGVKSAWEGLKSLGGGLTRRLPLIGTAIGATQILSSDNKLETAAKVGTEAAGGWAGAAAGAWAGGAAGALVGSIVPVVGTAVGGAVGASIGGIMGGIGGAFGGGMLFDKVKTWWNDAPASPPDVHRPIPPEVREQIRPAAPVLGPPIPVVPPVKAQEEKSKLVSLSIPSMPITLKADGVLQDVAGMLRLLRDPAVSNEVKRIIEKAFIDAMETRGGVPV